METQSQGGRDGGRRPPPTALGYFGEFEDEPKRYRNTKAPGRKRPDRSERFSASALIKGTLAEFHRLAWPSPLQVLAESFRTLVLTSAVSLPLWTLENLWSGYL